MAQTPKIELRPQKDGRNGILNAVTVFVPVKDLQVGDTVFDKDDKPRRILRISNGVFSGSKMIEYERGWSCLSDRTEVAAILSPRDSLAKQAP